MSRPSASLPHDRMAGLSTVPLWEIYKDLVALEPRPAGVAHLWAYGQVRALLAEAAEHISAEEAERRVLILKNPGLPRNAATQALVAGIQYVRPGEVAPAHRHSQGAIRLVLESAGGYTAVEGERCLMHRGDFITTPSWCWHDHANTGSEPLVWLDGLDVPLVNFLGVTFAEEHAQSQQPIHRSDDDSIDRYGAGVAPLAGLPDRPSSPILNYRYERVRAALDRMARADALDPHHGHAVLYRNPADGGEVLPTLSAGMQLLPRGFATRPRRSTASQVFCAIEGRGVAVVGEARFAFAPNDVLAVPNWLPFRFEAEEETVLFHFSERAAQQRLGLHREERL